MIFLSRVTKTRPAVQTGINLILLSRLEKLTFAVREAGVSWRNGGSIKGPLQLLNIIVL